MQYLCHTGICVLYGFSLCIIHCSKTSKRISEHNKNMFRAVDGKFKKHRYDNVLYIGHGDEYFVHKVRPVLYQIYLFVYDDVHAMEKETARQHEQYAKSFM